MTDKIPVRQLLEGLGVKHIFEVDTYQQVKLTELVIEATSIDEFSVVIARHPCMLKFTREQRKNPKYQHKHVEIDQGVCEHIHTCIESFGCPTFTRDTAGNVTINTDLCLKRGIQMISAYQKDLPDIRMQNMVLLAKIYQAPVPSSASCPALGFLMIFQLPVPL